MTADSLFQNSSFTLQSRCGDHVCPRKSERNLRERKLGFEQAADFDFATAAYNIEVRNGEKRLIAAGYLNRRLHILCFLPRFGGIRVISFRIANEREARKYGRPKTIDE